MYLKFFFQLFSKITHFIQAQFKFFICQIRWGQSIIVSMLLLLSKTNAVDS